MAETPQRVQWLAVYDDLETVLKYAGMLYPPLEAVVFWMALARPVLGFLDAHSTPPQPSDPVYYAPEGPQNPQL